MKNGVKNIQAAAYNGARTVVILTLSFYVDSGHVLARVPGVPGTCSFFRPYCLAPADFGRSVNPIQTRGADYAHHITTWHP